MRILGEQGIWKVKGLHKSGKGGRVETLSAIRVDDDNKEVGVIFKDIDPSRCRRV